MARRRGRAAGVGECRHLPAHRDPLTGRVHLEWRSHRLSRTPVACRICRAPAWLRDCVGAPVHKVCAETELARDLALAGATFGRQ